MTTAPLSNDARAIEELRSKLGGRLTIVGHHYEQEATIQHCDIRGDSLELARRVPGIASDYIVFCGVYFMAESAALLAREGQQVLLPDHSADCVMAQMTPARLLDRVLGRLTASGRKLVPLAYVNTSLAVKAVVGRYGGAVCTSANAEKMMNWAFRQGDGVLFLPDKNLARNTARKLGITGRDTHILDVRKTGEAVVDAVAQRRGEGVLPPGVPLPLLVEVRLNVVDEGVDLLRLVGVNHQTGALVQQHQILVLVDDIQAGAEQGEEQIILPGLVEELVVDV